MTTKIAEMEKFFKETKKPENLHQYASVGWDRAFDNFKYAIDNANKERGKAEDEFKRLQMFRQLPEWETFDGWVQKTSPGAFLVAINQMQHAGQQARTVAREQGRLDV